MFIGANMINVDLWVFRLQTRRGIEIYMSYDNEEARRNKRRLLRHSRIVSLGSKLRLPAENKTMKAETSHGLLMSYGMLMSS